jgi:hypothetical protein
MNTRGFALLIFCFAAASAHADPPPASGVDAFAGVWSYDAALSTGPGDAAGSDAAGSAPKGAGGRHRGGGEGGGGGHAGGMGGGHGGGHSHGDHAPAASTGGASKEDLAERGERGLARMFATRMTITPLRQRIRFDDGDHAVELDRDGMNVSGPGVGGTVALTVAKPDVTIQTLTDSGYALEERYHLTEDGHRLELHATLKRPGAEQGSTFVRVFDRAAAAPDATAAVASPAH